MSGRPGGQAPYWPDRAALRRRRSARRLFWVVVILLLVLPWLGYRQVRDWLRPEVEAPVAAVVPGDADGGPDAAGTPDARAAADTAEPGLLAAPASVDGVEAAGAAEAAVAEVDAIGRDALAGDGEAAVARLVDVGAQVHRDVLLSDRGSAVRREAARRELGEMPGVRAAGWIDRVTVLVLMPAGGSGHSTIAEACRRLALHGDVSGLAVRVQEVAGNDAAAGSLTGECRAGAGTQASAGGQLLPFPGTLLAGDAAGALGHGLDEDDPEAAAERRRRQEESLRILSESTPELAMPPAAPERR